MDKENIEWIKHAWKNNYSYNITWHGYRVLQFPQDLIGLQQIIWETFPSVIIECGVAYGGLTNFMSEYADVIAIEKGLLEETKRIRSHSNIILIEGSSIDKNTVLKVEVGISERDRVMVVLDSNHTHDHVLEELNIYSKFVTKDCYLVVQDTIIEFMPEGYCYGKEYDKGNNPHTAVMEFLKTTDRFEIDKDIENKLGVTCAPDGWLKCVK